MEILDSKLEGLVFFKPTRFSDARGFFSIIHNEKDYEKINIKSKFVQDAYSFSKKKGTLRGLHFQTPPFGQDQLVKVIRGSIFDVVVDLRKSSMTFGQCASFMLSEENGCQLFVPEGFAHGFLSLENKTQVYYKMSNFYSPENDGGLIWNDKDIDIEWPEISTDLIISEKDKKLPRFNDLKDVLEW